jgi:hypothetical protein
MRKIQRVSKLDNEKIWKLWKKGKLNSEMIWKILKKNKSNREMIWKIWKKGKLNSVNDINLVPKMVKLFKVQRPVSMAPFNGMHPRLLLAACV